LTTVASPTGETETRNPFATPVFRRWWIASVIAGAGVGIQSVTVPLFIRDRVALDQRAAAIAAALVVSNLVAAALTLFGGVAADRLERRRVLVRTYGIAAAASLVYVALSGADVEAVWPVYILASIVGAAGAFTNPARQSMVPAIVPRAQLANAIVLGNIGFMALVQFGGPAFGGILADLTGLTAAFAFEVGLLAIAAVLFGGVVTPCPSASANAAASSPTSQMASATPLANLPSGASSSSAPHPASS
jgi:MFS family permease